jgi:hypothetical protein
VTLDTHIDERPPQAWGELLREDPNATPAHRPELWEALADFRGGAARFVSVEHDGALLGGMGVIVERRAGHHWLHALPHLLPGTPLAVVGDHARVDSACARALDRMAGELGVVGGTWTCFRPRGPAFDEDVLVRLPGVTTHIETALVDLAAGLEPVRARLKPRMAQYLRNDTREFTCADEPETLEEIHVLHTRQARAWSGYRPLPVELSRRLLAWGRPNATGAGPLARLLVLRERGRLRAATLFLDHPRELFAWWSGIHPEARGRHVFPVLLWRAIEWAARAGRERVNLGGSAGRASLVAFKEALGATDVRVPVRWIGPDHARWTGRILARVQARLRARRPHGVGS